MHERYIEHDAIDMLTIVILFSCHMEHGEPP